MSLFEETSLILVLSAGLMWPGLGLSLAHAQNPPDAAAGQLERDRAAAERQRQLERNRLDYPPPGGATPAPPPTEAAPPDEICLPIQTITVTGVTLLTEAVRATARDYEGRCLGLSGLNDLLEQLTFLYLAQGYITSRAFLPEQDLADGALEIVVIEGRLEDIVMDAAPGAHQGQIHTAFPGQIGAPLNLRDIEQGLDQLNRLRANNATIELEAGAQPGASVLSVARQQGKRLYAGLGFDNLGSALIGEYQTRLDLGGEDLLRLNDQWQFSYQRSMDRHPLHFHAVPASNTYSGRFSIPYGYWTLAFDALSSDYEARLAGPVGLIPLSGLSQSVNVSLSRVLHRNPTSKTLLFGTLKWKRTENFILGNQVDASSRDLSVAGLELIHARQLWGGQGLMAVAWRRGLAMLGAFDDDSAPAGSPKGQFRSVTASLSYFKPFRVGGLDARYQGQLSGQYTPDLLFGSEQVAYGGYATVRGLRESVVFGNRGLLMRNELALRLPDNVTLAGVLGSFEVYTALDFGQVFAEHGYGIAGGNLTGATLGLRGRGGRLNLDVAWSDIIGHTDNLAAAVAQSGLFYVRLNLAF